MKKTLFVCRAAVAAGLLLLLLLGAPGAHARRQSTTPAPAAVRPGGGGADTVTAAADFTQVLSGDLFPLTRTLRDLGAENGWRALSVTTLSDTQGADYVDLGIKGGDAARVENGLLSALAGGADPATHYTRGQTVVVDGERYLVAYRPRPVSAARLAAVLGVGHTHNGGMPDDDAALSRPQPLSGNTVIYLSLLSLKDVGSLRDIRPFSLQAELGLGTMTEQQAREKAINTASVRNLKQVGVALMMYVQDYDETLPPMPSPDVVKRLLFPYVKNAAAFVHPETKEPYLPNPVLSRKTLAQIEAPAEFVALYEARPAGDNTRGVVFLDGHVKRVAEAEWPRIAAASKIRVTAAPAPTADKGPPPTPSSTPPAAAPTPPSP